jgi:hypothetical protein
MALCPARVRRSLRSGAAILVYAAGGLSLAWISPARGSDRFAEQRIAWPGGSLAPESHFGATLAVAEEGPGYAFVGAPEAGAWCTLERDPAQDWTSFQLAMVGLPQPFVATADADTLLHGSKLDDGSTRLVELPAGNPQLEGFGNPIDAIARQLRVIAVGQTAFAGNRGVVRIYENVAGTWGLAATFTGGLGDELGASLAIRDSILAAGAPGADGNGEVRVFARISGSWVDFQTLESPSTSQTGARFGNAVALSGPWLGVGSESLDRIIAGGGVEPDVGGVFLYRGTIGFTLDSLVRPSGLGPGAHFGKSLAMRPVGEAGTALVAGAPFADAPASDSGAAFLYLDWGDSWKLSARLLDAQAEAGDHLGAAIGLDGRDVLVGAPDVDGSLGEDEGVVLAFLDAVPIAYDGFESGDASGWSAAAP